MTAQSVYSRVAPGRATLIYTFKQLDPRTPGDAHEHERDLEGLLDAVQPGWRDVLVDRQYLPRIVAVGALPTAESGGFAGRPGPRVPDLENLYLAGDWVGPEGFLIDASVASARSAARLALEDSPPARSKTAGFMPNALQSSRSKGGQTRTELTTMARTEMGVCPHKGAGTMGFTLSSVLWNVPRPGTEG
jgi:hypothetical protein